MKKFLSVLLSLVMLMSLVSVSAVAEGETITIVWSVTEDAYKNSLANNPKHFDEVWSVVPVFEAETGIKVDVRAVAWGDMISTATSIVNAGESLDLVQANDQSFPVYPARNIIQPIADYVDVTSDTYLASVVNAFTYNGKAYAAGSNVTPLLLYYNIDMLEANGADLPRDLWAEGNWNWETFREVANAVTADTDGDGAVDQYGFGYWDTDYVSWLASNGLDNLIYNADGTITTGYLMDAGLETMTYLQELYTVDQCMWPLAGGDDWNAGWKNGKLGMCMSYGLGWSKPDTFAFECDWVPMPTGPSGAGDVGIASVTGWCIGATSGNPKAAARFIELSASMFTEWQNGNQVELYGQDRVDEMNRLAGIARFAPIGIDKYWDNNWTVFNGIRSSEPVVNFLTTAQEQVIEGYNSTMSN